MGVDSALQAGISGIKSGQDLAAQAADRIAKAGSSDTDNQTNDVVENVVDLKKGENQVKASAAVVKAADESLGAFIDVLA